ncbi:hypothetical protein D6B99_11185 [Arachidicoccus soli]|uniref:Uncharacterized protein n=1 Tax=Arachidicoccus soli TaxID=2341117 RepID=A0A386HRB5_9BACT|nr:hypothetical protein D6B99_11185 [Arachidicoccus soli]
MLQQKRLKDDFHLLVLLLEFKVTAVGILLILLFKSGILFNRYKTNGPGTSGISIKDGSNRKRLNGK